MAETNYVAEIKSSVAVSRKRDLNFALCYGKKPEDMVLVFHRQKNPEVLMRQAKKDGETNKVAYGTIRTKGKVMSMTLEDEAPPGLILQGKRYFSSIGLNMKLKLLAQDGTVLEADEDISAEDEIDEIAAQPEENAPKETQEPEVEDPNAKKWLAARGKVGPSIKEALTTNHPQGAKIKELWAVAVKRADDQDFTAALTILSKLVPLLKAGGTTASSEDKGTDGPSAQVLDNARDLWVTARGKMLSEMKRLEATILAEEKSDEINEPEDLAEIEARVAELASYLDPFDGRFEDALARAADASTPDQKRSTVGTALGVLEEFKTVLSDPFFSNVDEDNGYVNVAIASTGKSAIGEITKMIG